MNPFALLNPYRWLAAAVLLAVLTAAYFGWRHQQREIGAAGEREAWVKRDLDYAQDQAKEFQRRLARQEDSNRETRTRAERAETAARRAAAVTGSLREELAAADAERRRDSSAIANCAAAEAAVDLRDRLFRWADDAAGELARYAQAARLAGEQCERDYDALRPR